MGNCLKRNQSDDVSLLRSADTSAASHDVVGDLIWRAPTSYPERVGPQMLQVYETSRNFSGSLSGSTLSGNLSATLPGALTEEEQVKIAKRIGLIQHLPTGLHDGSKKSRECVICMIDFQMSDPVRYLPCLHMYHTNCIDDWLMRSLTCPTCMEPVDAALLNSYNTN